MQMKKLSKNQTSFAICFGAPPRTGRMEQEGLSDISSDKLIMQNSVLNSTVYAKISRYITKVDSSLHFQMGRVKQGELRLKMSASRCDT